LIILSFQSLKSAALGMREARVGKCALLALLMAAGGKVEVVGSGLLILLLGAKGVALGVGFC